MTPLRQRFIEDMNLAGLVPNTQQVYIDHVLRCVRSCGNTPPQNMSEQQVEDYIRQRLREVARGTFQVEFAALKALFHRTLGRDWAIFTKKKLLVPNDFDSPSPNHTQTVCG
jgi:hypothetical protein